MLEEPQLGGFARRDHPGKGMRPTVRFVLAMGSSPSPGWRSAVWASGPVAGGTRGTRSGRCMAWVIPIMLAYIPGLVIGFMIFTLIVTRYRPPALEPPGAVAGRPWPPVTVVCRVERGGGDRGDARAHRRAHVSRPDRGRAGGQQLDRPDRRARRRGGERLGLRYRRVFEPKPASTRAQHRAGDGHDAARGDRRRGHLAARARRSPTWSRASPAARRTSTCAPAPERWWPRTDSQLPHQDAGVGLPAGHQRRQAHAGRVQQRARRARRVLGVLDR